MKVVMLDKQDRSSYSAEASLHLTYSRKGADWWPEAGNCGIPCREKIKSVSEARVSFDI